PPVPTTHPSPLLIEPPPEETNTENRPQTPSHNSQENSTINQNIHLSPASTEKSTHPPSPPHNTPKRVKLILPPPPNEMHTEVESPLTNPPTPTLMNRELKSLTNPIHFEKREDNLPARRHNRPPPQHSNHALEFSFSAQSLPEPHSIEFMHSLLDLDIERDATSWHADSIAISYTDAPDYVFQTSTTLEPKSLAEALSRPDGDKWLDAAWNEILAHVKNGTFEPVPLPHGKKAIGCRWVFKVKRNSDGSTERYKGRIVAKGYLQREGIDYSDTFAPTTSLAAMRVVLAIAAREDMEIESIDVSTAYLNGEIDAEVYMDVPEGLQIGGTEGDPSTKLKLAKGLYGIKQAGRLWNRKLRSILDTLGFSCTDADHSVYIYQRNGTRIILPAYVDDLTICSNSTSAISQFKADLANHLEFRDLGPTEFILGIKVERDRSKRRLCLSQCTYIKDILDEHLDGYKSSDGGVNAVLTPMNQSRLSSKDVPRTPEELKKVKDSRYLETIGKLLYLQRATRPDIAFAVNRLCRFGANPGLPHVAALKHLLRYLAGTVNYKLVYDPIPSTDAFVTYADADLGGNVDNSRSTGGFAIMIGSGAVNWGSRLQRQVSLSSTESEYTNASAVGCEVIWTRYLLEDIGFPVNSPSPIYLDSNSAGQVMKNPEHQSSMKHVHRSYNWVREKVENKDLRVCRVAGEDNPADIFTKPLGKIKFSKFRDILGLRLME
ncbi:2345_t:CDS:1, partial [Acaulospora colombiana]